jgi:glycosyltransferase involved in cell wall biosynthesis
MSAPTFSVIIPVFNRAKVLPAAIQSVLAQTCPDFEIVVVDDGSHDDPESALKQFSDARIHFVRQENSGGGVARNTAIDAARGRFIAPLDSDDVFLPHHLERMKKLLDGTSNIAGYARILVDRGEGRMFMKPPRAIRESEDMGEYLLCDRGFVPTITVVVEREMAKKVRYHETIRAAEDTDFAIRLALAGCKFVMLEEPGAIWKDLADPNRTSAGNRTLRFGRWLEEMKPVMTRRAWRGAYGWAYARMAAREGRKGKALMLYLRALLSGCYAPKLAVVVFLQIFLNAAQYRRLADHVVAALRPGMDKPASASALKKA